MFEEARRDNLPTNSEIMTQMNKVDMSIDTNSIKPVEEFFHKNVKLLIEAVDRFLLDTQFTEGPELIRKKLDKYYLSCGGYVALGEALSIQLRRIAIEKLAEDEKKKTANVVEMYAKGQSAVVDSTLSMLKNLDKTLYSKVYGYNGYKKS